MSVDVLHGYRRQVPSLPHSPAELGHNQRVSTELLKEMAIDCHTVHAQDVSEHLGEDAFGAGRCGAAPILNQHRFSHCPSTMTFTLCGRIRFTRTVMILL